jgi:twitching motility protein PilT
MRQDPDVLLIGEMREAETVDVAIKAAETGHLVLSSLHTSDSASSLARLIGFFPSEQETGIKNGCPTASSPLSPCGSCRQKAGSGESPQWRCCG